MQLGVYDLSGRLVRQLTRGALDAGERVFSWDVRDEEDRAVATGVYWIRASSASGESVERVILVR
jgi:flagellar hook assembly protein FlgD